MAADENLNFRTPHSATVAKPMPLADDIRKKWRVISPFFWDLDRTPSLLCDIQSRVLSRSVNGTDNMTNAASHNLLGYILLVRDNDTCGATEQFTRALQYQQENLTALASMVYVNEYTGCEAEARSWHETVGRLNTDQPHKVQRETQANFEKGFFYARFGVSYQRMAETCLRRSIDCDKDNPVLLNELTSIMAFRLLEQNTPGCSIETATAPGYFDELTGHILKLIELDRDKSEYYTRMGEVLELSVLYDNCDQWRVEFYKRHPDRTKEACYQMASELSRRLTSD